jgi:calpain-7
VQQQEALVARSTGSAALDYAIAAAELYMKAAAAAKSSTDRNRLRMKCQELISYAERLKTGVLPPDADVPCVTRPIPPEEAAILATASRLHGNSFPPWDPGVDRAAVGRQSNETLFTYEFLFEDPLALSLYNFSV